MTYHDHVTICHVCGNKHTCGKTGITPCPDCGMWTNHGRCDHVLPYRGINVNNPPRCLWCLNEREG